MIPTLEEIITILLAWFRRQVWGLVKFIWWLSFRATPRTRLFVAMTGFMVILAFLCSLRNAGLLGRGRVLRVVRRLVDSTDRCLNEWDEAPNLATEPGEQMPLE